MATDFVTALFLTGQGHDHRGRKHMPTPEMQSGRAGPGHFSSDDIKWSYEHPLVEPQVSHLRQVPLRTMV